MQTSLINLLKNLNEGMNIHFVPKTMLDISGVPLGR